jgi:hypothetical protein
MDSLRRLRLIFESTFRVRGELGGWSEPRSKTKEGGRKGIQSNDDQYNTKGSYAGCVVLYCVVLCCAVLCCVVLGCAVLCCVALRCVALRCIVLRYPGVVSRLVPCDISLVLPLAMSPCLVTLSIHSNPVSVPVLGSLKLVDSIAGFIVRNKTKKKKRKKKEKKKKKKELLK